MKKPTAVQSFHISRLVMFSVLAVALLMTQSATGKSLQLTYNKQVLAYATAMSRADLLSAANSSRVANGLANLALNSTLNTSAQLKAQDMINNNYWSHVSPTGVQPWYWFDQAGYSYVAAGENLAYGFNTGVEVNTGWMNSPTHKANILGDYVDVGFGIASGPNYQGGENTVVVAHYGKPRVAAAPAPTPAPTAPAPSAPAPTAPTTTTPKATPTPATPTPQPTTPTPPAPVTQASPTTPSATEEKATPKTPTPVAAASTPEQVSVFEQLRQGHVPLLILTSIGLVVVAGVGFVVTHRLFMKHVIANGKKFVLHHPLLDIASIGLTTWLILSTTVGHLL